MREGRRKTCRLPVIYSLVTKQAGDSVGEESAWVGDSGLTPGRFPREEGVAVHSKYSCLENLRSLVDCTVNGDTQRVGHD